MTARAFTLLAVMAAAGVLAACTTGADPGSPNSSAPNPSAPNPSAPAAAPLPPAACLLDSAALAAVTGLTWAPDETTASDTRCVYDPSAEGSLSRQSLPAGSEFVAVDLAPSSVADVADELDMLAELCENGSRAPMAAADGGFVCRLQGGSVFAAAVRGGQVVTVAASAVPPGTTAARLVVAFTEQLTRIGN